MPNICVNLNVYKLIEKINEIEIKLKKSYFNI